MIDPTIPLPAQPAPPTLHSFTAGILIPGAQASITGIMIAIPAGVIAYLAQFQAPWAWSLLTWSLVQAIAWLRLLWRWLDLTRPLELATGLDLDGDGQIGEPATVRIQLTSDDGRQTQLMDLPTTEAKLITLAHALAAGAPLSESEWTGAGKLYSRSEFRTLRDEFLARGLVTWTSPDDHRQGVTLTKPGRAMMQYLATRHPSPTPLVDTP